MFTDNSTNNCHILLGEKPIWKKINDVFKKYNPVTSTFFSVDFYSHNNISYYRQLVNLNHLHALRQNLNFVISDLDKYYMKDEEAYDKFCTMIYFHFFNDEQWNKVLSLIEVFDFNEQYEPVKNKMINYVIEIVSMSKDKRYLNILGEMFYSYGLFSKYQLTIDEKYINTIKREVIHNYKREFAETIIFMYDELRSFLAKWPDSLDTIRRDMKVLLNTYKSFYL